MGLNIDGVVISVINRKYNKDHKFAGQVYGRLYQLQNVVNEEGYTRVVDVTDGDLTRVVTVGKSISLPVWCEIYTPLDKDGKQKDAPRLQFHALKGEAVKFETKEKGVKV